MIIKLHRLVWWSFLKFLKDKNARLEKYSHLEGNDASRALALKHGFKYTHTGEQIRNHDQKHLKEYFYELEL